MRALLFTALLLPACATPIVVPTDAGPPGTDAGSMPDSASHVDAGTPSLDSGPDAPSSALDAFTEHDAGLDAAPGPDATLALDAFAAPDAFMCGAGSVLVGATCTAIPAPRLIAPMSTATTTLRRPTFHWRSTAPADGALIEICPTRACDTGTVSFEAPGVESAHPSFDLTPGVHFWRATGMQGSTHGTAVSHVWEVFVPARNATLGIDSSYGTVGDYNGDGLADVLVGAPTTGTDGAVHEFLSTGAALALTDMLVLDETTADGGGAGYGIAVASAGDVDGDGYADAVIGTQSANVAYVYRGGPTGLTPTGRARLLYTGVAPAVFGFSVAGVGDIDGDGYGDIVVGESSGVACNGRLYVFSGSATGVAEPPAILPGVAGSAFGYAVAGAGDMDGDGHADVVVGAPYGSGGNAFAYRGSTTGLVSSRTLSSPYPNSFYGSSAVGACDINGDGLSDLVVGDEAYPAASSRGAVYAFLTSGPGAFGAAIQLIPDSAAGATSFGVDVSCGDLRGAGYADVVVGAHTYPTAMSSATGQVYVFQSGGATGLTLDQHSATSFGGASGGHLGNAVSAHGDIDGNGYADIVACSSTTSSCDVHRGRGAGVDTAIAQTISGSGGFGQSVE